MGCCGVVVGVWDSCAGLLWCSGWFWDSYVGYCGVVVSIWDSYVG